MPRQVRSDVSTPPSTGPTMPEKNPPEKKTPSARARAGPVYVALTIPRPVVMSVLPPNPWSTRAAMSAGYVGATAHNTEAAAKSSAPTRRIRRRPSLSPSLPMARIETANGMTYAVTTHASSDAVVPNAVPIRGIARFTIFVSRMGVNAHSQHTTSTGSKRERIGLVCAHLDPRTVGYDERPAVMHDDVEAFAEHLAHERRCERVAWRAIEDDPAIAEHRDTRGHRGCEVEVVQNRHDDQLPLARQSREEIERRALMRRIKVRCGFVEEEDLGLLRERHCEDRSLTLATGYAIDAPIREGYRIE